MTTPRTGGPFIPAPDLRPLAPAAQQAPAPAASIAELRTALAVYGKHMEFCEAVKRAAQTPGAVPSARHAACDCGMSNMIEGGPATGYVKALVGCNGLGTEHPAAAPATPAAAEVLSLERLLRTAHAVAQDEDVAVYMAQALLTPAGRIDLALDALAGAGFRGSVALWTDDPARLDLLPLRDPPQLRLEDSPPRVVEVARAVPVTSGAPLHVTISCFRPATLEDARRVLEGQG